MSHILRPTIQNYLSALPLSNFVGVTLTMKQQVDGQHLDPFACAQNLRHFINVLNKKIYKSQFTRFGVRLQIFPVLEKSADGRWHYHLIIERPKDLSLFRFTHMIETVWRKTRFGHREIHIDESIDHGWVKYITKFHSRFDQVDWENVHLN